MNKDEMIKDMAEILNKNCGNCSICEFAGKSTAMLDCTELCYATALYNAGYRKVADDEIVIKKSEYDAEQEKTFLEWREEYDQNCLLRLRVSELEKELEKAKQETAEKIYHKIKVEMLCKDIDEDRPTTLYRFTAFDIMKMARKIVEEFGVVFQDGHTSIGE